MKILFLLKKNNLYGYNSTPTSKSGLLNSARITAEQITKHFDVATSVRICEDANSINKEIHEFRPDLCIIEAIWVLPAKFTELKKHHPSLPFIIRVHSQIPFLSTEGEAVGRIYDYLKLNNVYIGFNSYNTYKNFYGHSHIIYLPNIYSHVYKYKIPFRESLDYFLNKRKFHPEFRPYNIGCFGAIRPLKNQLLQAFAAIEFGERHNRRINFFINSTRVEQGGESTLKNIRALFENYPKHKLVELPWFERKEFLATVSTMDIGMQLSFNESFNIVTADFVKQQIPIIVSTAIDWMPLETQIDTELVSEIVDRMDHILAYENYIIKRSSNALNEYNKKALQRWAHIK